MKSPAVNILYVHYGDNGIRGSEICLLNLLSTLDRKKFNPIVWCNADILAERVKSLGIRVIQSNFSLLFGYYSPRIDVSASLKLIKEAKAIIAEHKIDLVHCNSAAPCQWVSWACLNTSTKLLVHLHAPYPLRDRVTLGLNFADQIVSVNDKIQAEFLNDGFKPQRLSVIANGLKTQALTQVKSIPIRGLLGIPENAILIATVNYLNYSKGADNCIKMLATLHQAHLIKAHLMVIGDGPMRKELECLAQSLNIEHFVHFVGNTNQVQAIVKDNADLYVCGSREESFGLAIAEAILANIAVVAPKVGGIPMIVKHGITGLLYTNENIKQFSQQVSLLIEDTPLREQLKAAALIHVNDNFNLALHTENFESCYLKLIQQETVTRFHFSFKPIKRLLSTLVNLCTRKLKHNFSVYSG